MPDKEGSDKDKANTTAVCSYCKGSVNKQKAECKQCRTIWHLSCAKRKFKISEIDTDQFVCCGSDLSIADGNMEPPLVVDEIESELKRLKKDDLIRIIVNRKVPDDLSLSESLVDMIESGYSCESCSGAFANCKVTATEIDPAIRNELQLTVMRCDLRVARSEIAASKRLIQELERTIGNQELIISLLKAEPTDRLEVGSAGPGGKVNSSGKKKPAQTGEVASVNMESRNNNEKKLLSQTNPQTAVKGSVSADVRREGPKAADVKSVKANRPRQRFVWGNADVAGTVLQDTIVAAERLAWLYVGKLKVGTEAAQLRRYLNGRFPGHEFKIEALPQRNDATSVSFKVGATFGLLDDLIKESSWPVGVAVKKFVFFRSYTRRD